MDDPSDNAGPDADNRLLQRSRDGDRHAFSELWRRHAPVAVAYARTLGSTPPDPEDVVSEAFVSILHQLRSGGGPQRSFRPYLLTTVKNTWMTHVRRAPITTPIDDAEHPPSRIGAIDTDAMADSTILSEAFGSLPERWQHALWLSEVEQLAPREIAGILHIRPNSAAALTYRARDALRKAWIRAHLRDAEAGTEHARVLELLGAYAHDDLAPRSERFVMKHLDTCAACRSAAGEARDLARAMTLGPLLAGGAGLVIAPALFPADQAVAAVAATDPSTWFALQPTVEAAGHTAPLLWPVAAATAVALSVSGSLFVRPATEPDATGTLSPVAVAAATPAPEPGTVGVPADPPVTTPSPNIPQPADPAPLPQPVEQTPSSTGTDVVDKLVQIITKPGNPNGNGGANGRWSVDEEPDIALDDASATKKNANADAGANGNAYGLDKKDKRNETPGDDVSDFASAARGFSDSSIVVLVTADDESDTMSIAVWGAEDVALAFAVDGQTVATLSDETTWSTEVPVDGGDHTLTVHYLDESGAIGDVAAEAVVPTD